MAMEAKICGITTPEMARAVAEEGATHIGLMFVARSSRNLTIAEAAELLPQIPKGLIKVGVFVDPDDAALEAAISAADLDMVQLHGSESVARVDEVHARFGLPIIKAMSVATCADVEASFKYIGHVACILFDAKPPEDGDLPGGTGLQFDWSLLQDLPADLPWALSGGLSPDNVAEAIAKTQCQFVDVSSGVESRPGVKSLAKITAFMAAIKDHSNEPD